MTEVEHLSFIFIYDNKMKLCVEQYIYLCNVMSIDDDKK